MYSERIEGLMEAVLADGVIEESELAILRKAAEKEGLDPDEVIMVLKGRHAKMLRENPGLAAAAAPAAPQAAPVAPAAPQQPQAAPAPGRMFSPGLENLIQASIEDGVITEQEKMALIRRAQKEGVDIDELDIYIQSLLQKRHQAEAAARAEADRKSKMGTVKRCPNCGAEVLGGSAVCQACGYAFNDVKANSSAEKLLAKLEEFNKEQKKQIDESDTSMSLADMFGGGNTGKQAQQQTHILKSKMMIISNFPVPNTRADLLEFLTMVQPKANILGPKTGNKISMDISNMGEDLSYAYWQLYCNCINKAKISFSKDPDFEFFFEHHAQEIKKTNGIAGMWRTASPFKKMGLGAAAGFIVLIILSILIGILQAVLK